MQFDVNAILISIFSVATVTAGMVWVIKALVTKALDAGIEKYKQSLAYEMERHKSELERTKEMFLKEHAPRFEILAERRADVICKLYAKLLCALKNLDRDYLGRGIYRVYGETTEERDREANNMRVAHEARHQEANTAIKKFADYFDENRIFFSLNLCESVDRLLAQLQKMYDKLEYSDWYKRVKPGPSAPADNISLEYWNMAADLLYQTRTAIEEEFRALLGVSPSEIQQKHFISK